MYSQKPTLFRKGACTRNGASLMTLLVFIRHVVCSRLWRYRGTHSKLDPSGVGISHRHVLIPGHTGEAFPEKESTEVVVRVWEASSHGFSNKTALDCSCRKWQTREGDPGRKNRKHKRLEAGACLVLKQEKEGRA